MCMLLQRQRSWTLRLSAAQCQCRRSSHSAILLCVILLRVSRGLQGQWLSPRVVNLTLQYLTVGIRQARTWKLLQPHVPELMQRVLFPLMCFANEDQELWDDDPLEYIRKVPRVASFVYGALEAGPLPS